MGVGDRAVYLRNYLLSHGIFVEGRTVTEVVASYDSIKRAVKVSEEVDAKVDSYRSMGGDRRPEEKRNARLDKVKSVRGLRGYILARHGYDIGKKATLDDAVKVIETVGKKRGWRDRKEMLDVAGRIAQTAPVKKGPKKASVEAPVEEKRRDPFSGEDGDPRPYPIRNFTFSFRRAFWAPPHPEHNVSFSSDPMVMVDYGHVTVQYGTSVYLGELSRGDAVVVLSDPRSGISTAALLPMGGLGGEAMEAIREREMKGAFVSTRGAGIKRHVILGDAALSLEDLGTPHAYEFGRIVKEHVKIVPGGASTTLKAIVLFAEYGDGDSLTSAVAIAGAAQAMGVEVLELVSVSEKFIEERGGGVFFDSAGGDVKVGDETAASLGDSRKSWAESLLDASPFGDTVHAKHMSFARIDRSASDDVVSKPGAGSKKGTRKTGAPFDAQGKAFMQAAPLVRSLK